MYKEYQVKSLGKGNIHVSRWEPEGRPVGVFQIVHGISEYAKRYDAFARYLTERGFLVVAEDHMGHGHSISAEQARGYFYGGWFTAVGDTYALLQKTKEEYPDVPYILFGHSMGSFMARTILAKYPESGISACIICGTGWQPEAVLAAGQKLSNVVCKVRGEQNPSKFLHKVIFGAYNKRVERPRTAYDWLTRVNTEVDTYMKDPLCGFIPSAGLVRDMLTGIGYIQKEENLSRMEKSLPVFFVAGGDDPVGDFGNGVRKAADVFRDVGMEDVSVRIYPLCRHEILNEMNKAEVYEDILAWTTKRIKE